MAEKYKEKKPTGREYVDLTKAFCNLTIHNCLMLPERWENILLAPLVQSAQKIEEIVVAANKIYINEQTMKSEQLIPAYTERSKMLQEAIRMFAVFDTAFERLFAYIDIAGAEKNRLKNILLSIINEEKKNDPQLTNIEITVVSRKSDMEYTSKFGTHYCQLKLTRAKKDRWLDVENAAIDKIRERISMDNKAIARHKSA